jgi:indolepyruvate ferredoxin oxidoreductase beta subunit
MKTTINFLLAGVGGQGTILASDVLVNLGLAAGYSAKQAEIHGMSQRGGSVTSHVRWGKNGVYSPIAGAGEIDVLLAFEKAEALRVLPALRKGALALVNMESILPLTVTSGGQPYPDDERLKSAFAEVTPNAVYIAGGEIAAGLGSAKTANVVLLGALAAMMQASGLVAETITPNTWLEVVTQRVPSKWIELNQKAFKSGFSAVTLQEIP